MTTQTEPPEQAPGEPTYLLVCAAALTVMLMVAVLEQGMSCWALVPVLIGVLGLVTRWSSAPLLLVFTLAAFELVLVPLRNIAYALPGGTASPVSTLILCGAVLAYVAGAYRLQGLVGQLFPADPRRPGGRIPRAARSPDVRPEEIVVRQRRSSRLVTPREVTLLVASLPLWAAGALALWSVVSVSESVLGLPPGLWRLLLIGWIFGLGLLLASAAVGYVAQQGMTRAEATLLLQDLLWQETRGEQRRINRWLAWARLVRSRRKETP